MSIQNMTDREIERRLDTVEKCLASEMDGDKIPLWNLLIQSLINEQARRDVSRGCVVSVLCERERHNAFIDDLKSDVEFEPLRDFIDRLME